MTLMSTHVWVISACLLLVAIGGLLWVTSLYNQLEKTWRLHSGRITELEDLRRKLMDRVADLSCRLDALEKRPPVVNVTMEKEQKK